MIHRCHSMVFRICPARIKNIILLQNVTLLGFLSFSFCSFLGCRVTERGTGRVTERGTGRVTERGTGRVTERVTGRVTERGTGRVTERGRREGPREKNNNLRLRK